MIASFRMIQAAPKRHAAAAAATAAVPGAFSSAAGDRLKELADRLLQMKWPAAAAGGGPSAAAADGESERRRARWAHSL